MIIARWDRRARSTFHGEGRVRVGAERLNIRLTPASMDESSIELDFIGLMSFGARA